MRNENPSYNERKVGLLSDGIAGQFSQDDQQALLASKENPAVQAAGQTEVKTEYRGQDWNAEGRFAKARANNMENCVGRRFHREFSIV